MNEILLLAKLQDTYSNKGQLSLCVCTHTPLFCRKVDSYTYTDLLAKMLQIYKPTDL